MKINAEFDEAHNVWPQFTEKEMLKASDLSTKGVICQHYVLELDLLKRMVLDAIPVLIGTHGCDTMGEMVIRFFQSNKKLELRISLTQDLHKSRLFGFLTENIYSKKTVKCVPSMKHEIQLGGHWCGWGYWSVSFDNCGTRDS